MEVHIRRSTSLPILPIQNWLLPLTCVRERYHWMVGDCRYLAGQTGHISQFSSRWSNSRREDKTWIIESISKQGAVQIGGHTQVFMHEIDTPSGPLCFFWQLLVQTRKPFNLIPESPGWFSVTSPLLFTSRSGGLMAVEQVRYLIPCSNTQHIQLSYGEHW